MNLKNLFDLSGKTAIITGGATGLGKQMADALAEAGANLVLAARKVERCEAAASEIKKTYGVGAIGVKCDLAKEEDIVNLVNETQKTFGSLDILINNSGTTWGAPAEEYPLDRWQQVINVNLTGSFIAAKEAFKVMKKQASGKIINIASVFGMVGAKSNIMDAAAYNASKGAMLNLTRDLAVKWAPQGVNVNAISPGWFPTHIAEKHIEAHRQEFLDYIPAGRFGSEDDLKGAVVFLASKASDYVYGQVLVVDGGWIIH